MEDIKTIEYNMINQTNTNEDKIQKELIKDTIKSLRLRAHLVHDPYLYRLYKINRLNRLRTPASYDHDLYGFLGQNLSSRILYYERFNRELTAMQRKLYRCIPLHSSIYICINFSILSITSLLLFLRFGLNIYLIDPYYLICALLISTGLMLTALVSLKDWRRYLRQNEKTK